MSAGVDLAANTGILWMDQMLKPRVPMRWMLPEVRSSCYSCQAAGENMSHSCPLCSLFLSAKVALCEAAALCLRLVHLGTAAICL
jgi:hypothetical protein